MRRNRRETERMGTRMKTRVTEAAMLIKQRTAVASRLPARRLQPPRSAQSVILFPAQDGSTLNDPFVIIQSISLGVAGLTHSIHFFLVKETEKGVY